MSHPRRIFVLLSLMLVALAPFAQAQVTTGNLAGVVMSEGSALPGVTIEAVHVPTGTRYNDVTGGDGRFNIPNVRVGGPYTVTANLEGFKTATINNVTVNLGTTAEVPVTMALASVSESITVTADVDPIINPNRTGSTSEVSTEQIETLPTVNRSLQDFARTNPYFRVDPTDVSSTRINVAGRNNRYNSIQIDGAVNNDLFGLADTGTPGGQTDAQPISLDAIQELQMVVSPYDVRQGGFTGGGINAITRSGSNDWSGSVFGSTRNADLVGDGPRHVPYTKFDQDQYGGRLGGPIMKDRLFFFVSGEINRKSAPSGVAASASDYPANLAANLAKVASILKARYNYDPGTLDDINAETESDALFGRLDLNAGNNQLTLRHNYVSAGRDVLGTRTTSRFTFPTSNYNQHDETNSTVAQLNSVFSANAYNEARVGYQTIKDKRAVPVQFAAIEIGGSPQSATITAGTERFSGANALDQTVTELTDDFTLVKGSHTLVIGSHNEFFEFTNLFQSDAYGAYFFGPNAPLDTAIAAFEANKPTEYRITYATGADPLRPTSFEAAQLGFYVNDTWRVSNALNLVFGVRADMPRYPDTPSANPIVATALAAQGRRTDVTPSEDPVISPRLGFNWSLGNNSQLRGGIGMFTGRTPFVWVSNAYAGTGVEQISLTCLASQGCAVPAYNPDITAQPRNVGTPGAPGTLTVDLIDPDFQFPRLVRSTLGYDRDLFWGIRGSAEAVYSKTQQDVFYYNVNNRQTGVNPVDGRPVYTKVDTAQLADAYLLTNTSKGRDLTMALQLVRPYSNGLAIGAGYAWQDAKSAFDATSSRAVSNWRFRHTKGNIFEDDLSNSAFEVEQRFNANLSYNFRTGPLKHDIGFYYNMQSGRPFSMMLTNDANNDRNTGNDLLWVPGSSQTNVVYQFANGSTSRTLVLPDGTTRVENAQEIFRQFMDRFGVNQGSSKIVDRYQFEEPWNRQLDFHYEMGFTAFGVDTGLTFDVLNALNLIDDDYGTVRSIANQNITIAGYTTSTVNGVTTITYKEAAAGRWNADSLFTSGTNDLRSRWQGRVGVRVSF